MLIRQWAVVSLQFSVLGSRFSVLSRQFSVGSSQSAVLSPQFSVYGRPTAYCELETADTNWYGFCISIDYQY